MDLTSPWILSQMVRLLKGLRDYQLPDTIRELGGVTFDEYGRVVSTVCRALLELDPGRRTQLLSKADWKQRRCKSLYSRWCADGIRRCLVTFVANGVLHPFEALETAWEETMIHADSNVANLLRSRITTLLDYDLAYTHHVPFLRVLPLLQ
ncbi:hypothetical protein F4678DRAFT_240994 [Xylaria arbuscula]|nr:hypothetical protein F4678DRAFT_240994 [Xylaria arbuscula]